jgi:hypothetical protein
MRFAATNRACRSVRPAAPPRPAPRMASAERSSRPRIPMTNAWTPWTPRRGADRMVCATRRDGVENTSRARRSAPRRVAVTEGPWPRRAATGRELASAKRRTIAHRTPATPSAAEPRARRMSTAHRARAVRPTRPRALAAAWSRRFAMVTKPSRDRMEPCTIAIPIDVTTADAAVRAERPPTAFLA